MENVSQWPIERKLQEALTRSLPKLAPGVREQVSAMLTPEALGIMAAVLVAWVASHAFGVGEAVDLIIVAVGAFSIGLAVFEGLDQLYQFAVRTYQAQTTNDLDAAASHFASAVSILGVQAVLAVLMRGAPKSYRGGVRNGVGPRIAAGVAYRPTLRWSKFVKGYGNLPAGSGWTTSWGNIVVSSRGSSVTRQLVMFHERIHQILTPKVARLRDFRISNRNASYKYSSLSRYLEEALAESYAQLRVHGLTDAIAALRFPLKSKYVYLFRRGGYDKDFKGMGVITELVGIGAVVVEGVTFDLFLGSGDQDAPKDQQMAAPQAGHGASGSW